MQPAALIRERGELGLSAAALTDLMTAVLAKGKAFRFRAKGWSMSPFIKDGDIITVSPPGGRAPRTGDIVAFLHPASGHVGVHRIVRASGGAFLIRGDNVYGGDGSLPRERILGTVTEVVRDGRKVRGVPGRLSPAIAFLSRTGGLVRGLGLLRRLARRPEKGAP
jgi:hypothetical protein